MVLSDKSIKEELKNKNIIIEPLGENAIQPASVDVRLDENILVFRNTDIPYIDVKNIFDEKYNTALQYSQIDRTFNFGIKRVY